MKLLPGSWILCWELADPANDALVVEGLAFWAPTDGSVRTEKVSEVNVISFFFVISLTVDYINFLAM